MTKKPDIDKEDEALFREAMRGVTPLKDIKANKVIHEKPEILPRVRRIRDPYDEEPEFDPFSDHEKLAPLSGDDLMEYSRSGLQHKILRNLRNGKYNIEAILDLHGKTSLEARKSLGYFLLSCQKRGVKCALIIHGKGHSDKPVLKNKLNHWLRQTDQVLAFSSAIGRHGRGGAIYVLLKEMSTPSR